MAANVVVLPYRPRHHFQPFHDTDKRWSCIVAHRRAGKTVACIRQLERAALRCQLPNPRFAYIAPLFRQAKDAAWQYLKEGAVPLLRHGAKIHESELRVDYPNGGRVRIYGADNPDSLRGIYLDGVVLDEYADMKPTLWDEVLRPALSDRQGWATFIGTPKGRDGFYNVWRNAQKSDDWFTLELRASKTHILPETELDAARTQMGLTVFNREYECSFDEPGINQFIESEIVDQARERKPEILKPVVMGIDVARFGDDQTCFLIRTGDKIACIERRHGLDLMQVAGLATEFIGDHRPQAVFVDGVGVGGGVVDRLRQLNFNVYDVNAGGSPIRSDRFTNKRIEMWSAMKDWLKAGGCLPDDRQLADDLTAPLYEFDQRNRMKLERKEEMKSRGISSPDAADALALTFAMPVAMDEVYAMRPVVVVGSALMRR